MFIIELTDLYIYCIGCGLIVNLFILQFALVVEGS